MTRVLLLINRLTDQGGAEVSTLVMLQQLQGHGFDFHVVTLYGKCDAAIRPELETRGAQFSVAEGNHWNRLAHVSDTIAAFKPDVVHGTLFEAETLAVAAARRAKLPSIVSLVNTQYDEAARAVAPSPKRLELVRHFETRVINAATQVHTITEAVAAHGRRNLGLTPARTTVVPRGRNAELLGRRRDERRADTRRDLGIDEHIPVLLHVARHEPQKGHGLLLASFGKIVADHPDAQLLLAGRDGTETRSITRLISDLQLSNNVRILGARPDVANLHCAADVFCFPSRYEGLGGSVIEAMALETPIVSFAIDVIAEVTDGHAHLVEPFDTEAFSTAVLEVLRNPDDPHTEAARARFEADYTDEASAKGMADLYRSVARRAPAVATTTTQPIVAQASSLARAVADQKLRTALNDQARIDGVYFRSHDWLAAWWNHAADRPTGTTRAWFEADQLIGFSALARTTRRLQQHVPLQLTSWQIAGTGVGAADHAGWPAPREIESEITAWMTRIAGRDSLQLANLDAAHRRQVPLNAMLVDETRCPRIDLTTDAGPSKSFAKKLRYYRRKLGEAGVAITAIEPEDVTANHIETLIDLHGDRSDMADRTSSFTRAMLPFHAALAESATNDLGPGVFVARVDAEVVGMLYGFWAGTTFAYYQSGWKPEMADLSLGTVLVADAIDHARARGATRFDLLRGEEPYKYRFGATDHIDSTWVVPSLTGRAWHAARSLKRRLDC